MLLADDESGTHADGAALVVGGTIGAPEDKVQLDRRWRELLEKYAVATFGIRQVSSSRVGGR